MKSVIFSANELFLFLKQYKTFSFCSENKSNYFGFINGDVESLCIEKLKLYYCIFNNVRFKNNSKKICNLENLCGVRLCGNTFKYEYENYGFMVHGKLSSDILESIEMELFK